MVEGQPRPAMVNKSELPKKPLGLLARTGNWFLDLAMMTILSGAIMDDGKSNETISPMSKSQKTSVVK